MMVDTLKDYEKEDLMENYTEGLIYLMNSEI